MSSEYSGLTVKGERLEMSGLNLAPEGTSPVSAGDAVCLRQAAEDFIMSLDKIFDGED